MKIFLKLLLVFALIISCQDQKKEPNSPKSILEKNETTKKKKADVPKNQEPLKVLAKSDFERFFPKQIGDYNLIQVNENQTLGVGSGAYIKGKDYGNSMTYIVTDGHRKGASAIRLFEGSYESGSKKTSGGSEFICKERDGFKTVALLQEQHNSYKISTLYNDRFILTVQGREQPDEFWTYLKQANLQILDAF